MDVCVTVPKGIWWDWLEEGELPDEPLDDGSEFHFFLGGGIPDILPGERVYIVAHGMVRGYAPLVRIDRLRDFVTRPPYRPPSWWWPGAICGLVRHGGAVAVTIPEPVRGFRGFRERWWEREIEVPFPDYQTRGVTR
jgi:hypothetical protein